MKTLFLIITTIILSINLSFAQAQESEKITMLKSAFQKNGEFIHHNEVLKILESDPKAYQEMKSAIGTRGFGMVLSTAGGFLVGWPVGTAIGGGKPVWALAGVGAGLLVISIPVVNSFKKKAQSTLDTYYTTDKSQAHSYHEPKLYFSSNGSNIGLVLKF